MCGRFVRFRSWADLRATMMLLTGPELPASYNIAPTQNVLVARCRDGSLESVAMKWGLIPSWATDKKIAQINARADSAPSKPMFRSAFKKRRCLILADGYYEWKTVGKLKQPFYFRMKEDRPFLFAGLWETWQSDDGPIDTCAILTTDANGLAREVHSRMPCILEETDALAWVDSEVAPEALKSLLLPFPEDRMETYAVDSRVGNVRNNSPDCIKPSASYLGF